MSFNSAEYSFADITVLVGGVDITGLLGIKVTEKADKAARFAKGRKPKGIQTGNISYEGELMVTDDQYKALVASSPGKSLLRLSADVIINFGNTPDPMVTSRVVGVQITESGEDWKQGDKFADHALPFIAMDFEQDI